MEPAVFSAVQRKDVFRCPAETPSGGHTFCSHRKYGERCAKGGTLWNPPKSGVRSSVVFYTRQALYPRPQKTLLVFSARCLCSALLVRSLGDFQGRTMEVQPTAFAAGSRANQTAAGKHHQGSAPQEGAAVLCGFTKGRALCWFFPPFLSTQKWGRRRHVPRYAAGKNPSETRPPLRSGKKSAGGRPPLRSGNSPPAGGQKEVISSRRNP